ncbi:LacI family DNA-binding transcriptional regulator [Euzebya tangerina]|uniref:LacI family DNA-binding transcriptional regulator n=1 Tax=Euzebya tangerina TaxID=591198 RepID=UPI000E31874F|nr:LacI family DNA-binding transcriptional regulator [Euzebya tangerina]
MPYRSAPTILDVAAKAGVSKSLVSLVMRGSPNVSDDRRQAVLEAADELGYRPNAAAASLARQRTHLIGVMVSDFGNPFFSDMLEGIEEAALLAGYRALFNTGSRIAERETMATETLLELRTEGLILGSPRFADDLLAQLPKTVPVVTVGRDTAVPGIDVVMNDDRHGAELVVQHLTELGHRRIVHLHGLPGAGAAARRDGFVEAMESRGLEPRLAAAGFTERGGIVGAEELLRGGDLPTAIFAANDISAVGVMQTLEQAGLRVPDDISIVGYDNVAFTGLGQISLTTIDQPRHEMGTIAVDLLIERLDGTRSRSKHVTVEPALVERGSTAPPARRS